MFTLSISCLTTANLPWFMDLTFLVPMQYCSLQLQTMLLSPVPSTTEHHFHFSPAMPFFLKLLVIALCSSPVAHWTPSNKRGSSSGLISSFLLILFVGFLQQEGWSVLPFPPPMVHVLSALFTMTHPSCVALHGMAYRFIDYSYCHVILKIWPQKLGW